MCDLNRNKLHEILANVVDGLSKRNQTIRHKQESVLVKSREMSKICCGFDALEKVKRLD